MGTCLTHIAEDLPLWISLILSTKKTDDQQWSKDESTNETEHLHEMQPEHAACNQLQNPQDKPQSHYPSIQITGIQLQYALNETQVLQCQLLHKNPPTETQANIVDAG